MIQNNEDLWPSVPHGLRKTKWEGRHFLKDFELTGTNGKGIQVHKESKDRLKKKIQVLVLHPPNKAATQQIINTEVT